MRMLLAAAVALALVSCNDEEAELRTVKARQEAEKVRKEALKTQLAPDLRKLFAKVDALRPMLAGVPRAAAGSTPPSTQPAMKLSENNMADPAGNTDLLFEEELPMLRRGMLGTCNYYLRNGSSDLPADRFEEIMKRGLRTRYFLVVRTDQKTKPKIGDRSSYSEGSLDGDVVVFDLTGDPPKPLGSFALHSELTSPVKILGNTDLDSIQHDLDEALRKTALIEIERHLPR